MKESLEFLDNLAEMIRPLISFITTKWDTVVPKEISKLIAREGELKEYWRTRFPVRDGAVFRCEASCSDDLHYLEPKRQELIDRIFARYFDVKLIALDMPFWEWTRLEKAAYIGTFPFKVTGAIIREVAKGLDGVEFRVEIQI